MVLNIIFIIKILFFVFVFVSVHFILFIKSLVICSFDTADEVVTSIDPKKVEILQRYMVIDSQDFMMR